MNITAKELSGVHLLSKVTIPFEGQQITGTLIGLSHDADIITEQPLCSTEPTYELGRRWVYVTIAGSYEKGLGGDSVRTTLKPNTPITIQEEQ